MFTVGLVELDRRFSYVPLTGDGWRLIRLAGKGRHGKILEGGFSSPELNAIAILGQGPEKFRLAQKALSSRKHLLIEFPATETVDRARALNEKAIHNSTWIYSPNLLKTEPSLKMLSQRARDSGRLLSLTVTSGVEAKQKNTEFLLRVAQLLDLVEWLADSKLREAYCEKSTVRLSMPALVVLASFNNDVKAMLNVYSAGADGSHVGLCVDGVYEDCILHADPYAQSIRIIPFREERVKSINWSTTSMVEVIEDLTNRIEKAKQPLDLENLQRLLDLAEQIVGG